jgi:hypothetical protein
MRGARYGSNTELMDPYSRGSTSWPRHAQGDHVQAILDMSEAYLHAAANCHENGEAHSDRLRIPLFCISVRQRYINVSSAANGVQRASILFSAFQKRFRLIV